MRASPKQSPSSLFAVSLAFFLTVVADVILGASEAKQVDTLAIFRRGVKVSHHSHSEQQPMRTCL